MSQEKEPYQPVHVTEARGIAERYQKRVVVITAWDEAHGRLHTTTYGVTAQDKLWAAELGELLSKAAGAAPDTRRVHEDFRTVPAAEYKAQVDRLERIRDRLLAACERALEQIRHCDCTNGVTSPMGDIDEGNVWAGETMDQLINAINKAKGD
jgi:hypothetical protein